MSDIFNFAQMATPLRNPVATIGNFDGVHRGHLTLFEMVKQRAAMINGQSVVITFDPHPLKVMRPGNGPSLITPTEQKLNLIKAAGIEIIFCIPFTKDFAAISARKFVQDILLDQIGIREIVVGYDYSFGRGREGNIELLKEMGQSGGFLVHVAEPVKIGDKLVSSTAIRKLVEEGNLSDAKLLLGRDYQICGQVIKGMNRGGRLLGFPTANLDPVDELVPRVGVYAVHVLIDDVVFEGVTNIGYNPTFGKGPFSVETHILDFERNLVGQNIIIRFKKRLRSEKKFGSIDELSDQIQKDVMLAKKRAHLEKVGKKDLSLMMINKYVDKN